MASLHNPGIDCNAHFVEFPREKVICAFNHYEALRFRKRLEKIFHARTRAKLIVFSLDEELRLEARCEVGKAGLVYRNPEPDQGCYTRIFATHAQPDP